MVQVKAPVQVKARENEIPADESDEKAPTVQVKALEMAVDEEDPSDQSYRQRIRADHEYGVIQVQALHPR
jgi:hypothetical protein